MGFEQVKDEDFIRFLSKEIATTRASVGTQTCRRNAGDAQCFRIFTTLKDAKLPGYRKNSRG
ncbi:hypothetical protein PILCRDRAFT_818823 [Piloderma croceum F 1598]|uniref:Uncharacterized protein n=1 Tax=Piloderma croceum (strain F 1598) TaxID=765440 RepID=A0A0C3FW65_PILCF|nr:hypothetical protein PILCRDRAFT_818823 [Piloderma croceum F 1598]